MYASFDRTLPDRELDEPPAKANLLTRPLGCAVCASADFSLCMRSVPLLLLALLLLLSPALQAVAWGPITHQMFAFDFVSDDSFQWIATMDPDSLYGS